MDVDDATKDSIDSGPSDVGWTKQMPREPRSSRPAPEFGPGDTIGAFRVQRVIRAGGFATVYAACDQRSNELVALKLLHAQYRASSLMRRFAHEAEILAELGHPNIVALREFSALPDGRHYLAMELLEGRDLSAEIRRFGRLALSDIRPILAPLCSALKNAHERGIIHRDIKPSNVFLASHSHGDASPDTAYAPHSQDGGMDGSGELFSSRPSQATALPKRASSSDSTPAALAKSAQVPKDPSEPPASLSECTRALPLAFSRLVLLDFGIAKSFEESGLTASGQLLGTPPCMAPEQLAGGPVDARTDSAGVGALLFTMLTARLPFQSNEPGLIRHVMRSLIEVPRISYFVSVPHAIDALVARAMSRDPSRRFRSVCDLLAAFDAAMECDSGPFKVGSSRRDLAQIVNLRLRVDMTVDPDELEDPDEALLDDLESIVPFLALELEGAGYFLDAEAGNAAIFSLPLPGDAIGEREVRRAALQAALYACAALNARPGADDRIAIRMICDVERQDERDTDSRDVQSDSYGDGLITEIQRINPAWRAAVLCTAEALRGIEGLPRTATDDPELFYLWRNAPRES